MRIAAWGMLVVMAVGGCGGDKDGAALVLPKVYPPVRASTPTGLIADPRFTATVAQSLAAAVAQMTGGDTMPGATGGDTMPGAISLGTAVQERLYTPGPTLCFASSRNWTIAWPSLTRSRANTRA